MSWGRLDDGFWEHDKTKAAADQDGETGLAALGAFWIMVSFCLRNFRSSFSIYEAMMCLRRDRDHCEQILLRLLLREEGFEHGFLLQTNAETYEINSFRQYAEKDQAKSAAGRKGGVKSGESRRKKAKQKTKQREANEPPGGLVPNDPDPDPDPDPEIPIPIPDRHPCGSSGRSNKRIVSLSELEKAGSQRFGAIPGSAIRSKLEGLLPIDASDLDAALRSQGRSWKYAWKVIATHARERRQLDEEEASLPTKAAPPRRRRPTADEMDAAALAVAREEDAREALEAREAAQ